jgi:hypothetical protein
MTSDPNPTDEAQVIALLDTITQSWIEGDFEELGRCFHAGIVIRGPALEELGRGQAVCVNSYRDFITNATVADFEESRRIIDMWGDTAMAISTWEIAYTMNGEFYLDRGSDVFVLTNDHGRWLVVSRTMLPESEEQ